MALEQSRQGINNYDSEFSDLLSEMCATAFSNAEKQQSVAMVLEK